MDDLIGWGLLLGMLGMIALIAKLTGPPGEAKATCGTGVANLVLLVTSLLVPPSP